MSYGLALKLRAWGTRLWVRGLGGKSGRSRCSAPYGLQVSVTCYAHFNYCGGDTVTHGIMIAGAEACPIRVFRCERRPVCLLDLQLLSIRGSRANRRPETPIPVQYPKVETLNPKHQQALPVVVWLPSQANQGVDTLSPREQGTLNSRMLAPCVQVTLLERP